MEEVIHFSGIKQCHAMQNHAGSRAQLDSGHHTREPPVEPYVYACGEPSASSLMQSPTLSPLLTLKTR